MLEQFKHANIYIALIDDQDVKEIFKDDKAKGEVYGVLSILIFFWAELVKLFAAETLFTAAASEK